MAQQYQIDVKDESSVREWQARAQALNERAAQTVREAANALNEFKDTAEGNVFEEVCKYSEGVISGMTKILDGMNELLTVVNKLMETVKSTISDLVGGVGSVISTVLG